MRATTGMAPPRTAPQGWLSPFAISPTHYCPNRAGSTTQSLGNRLCRGVRSRWSLGHAECHLTDRLIDYSEDLKVIKDKQGAHQDLIGQLIGVGEEHTKSLERIEAIMATKDDIKNMATKDDISKIVNLLQQIAKKLP